MAESQNWATTLQSAFPAEFERIVRTIHAHPDQSEILRLFLDLASHVQTSNAPTVNGIVSKKRKIEDDAQTSIASHPTTATIQNPVTQFECKDVSVQIPARKKMKLLLVKDAHADQRQQIRLQHSQSNETEYALSFDQIDQVFCLPVPEKQQRQWNFCVFPKAGATAAVGNTAEQIVLTINETAPVGAVLSGYENTADDTYLTVTEKALNQSLAVFGRRVIRPDPHEFQSSKIQPHRKTEKAYHVNAHRGSKEGYLFFLENGIVFGFKKPLAFFPFSSIEAISYTSVLQRTFNLVITPMSVDGSTEEVKDVEFGMLDQADFAGIDEYIKKHELNDASMAAQRRAKEYGVNKEKKGPGADNEQTEATPGEEEMSELQKAEQQLQDEEDELEEDYEASGGESDGSGADSDEEGDDDQGDDDDAEENGDDGEE